MASTAYLEDGTHSAADAALGFYYQSLYALLSALKLPHDDGAVCVERLDDVEVLSNGQPLLAQLKHSLSEKPNSVSLSSRALWKTLKAWIDVLPRVELKDTRFQLVTVAPLSTKDSLGAFLDESSDRTLLNSLLLDEAQRVVDENQRGKAAGIRPLPHADRLSACHAFLKLDEPIRTTLISRITVTPGASDITQISNDISNTLINFPPERRQIIGEKLIEWWDLQVIYSLCEKRERAISKLEVLHKVSELAGEIERDQLIADYEFSMPPDDHIPDSMIACQIRLVGGTKSEIQSAEREEWRARSQRHKWISSRVDMAVKIDQYDELLREAWADKHGVMSETCASVDDTTKQISGLELFRWSFHHANAEVRPFAPNWSASYYVRGSYQIMAVQLKVGWHPDFETLLTEKKA